MAIVFEVQVGADLIERSQTWPDEDFDRLVALVEELEIQGFDLIAGSLLHPVEWLTIEFIEPGESPDMLWARVYLHSATSSHTLRISRQGFRVYVDTG